MGFPLYRIAAGRTALLVGVGNIGRAIGEMLHAAGTEVAGVGRSGDPLFGDVPPFAELDARLGAAD